MSDSEITKFAKAFPTCEEVEAFLGHYLDEELNWTQDFQMKWHLWRCEQCRAYLEGYRQTLKLGQSLADTPTTTEQAIPPQLLNALMKANEQDLAQ